MDGELSVVLGQHLTAVRFAIDEAEKEAEATRTLCTKLAPELLKSLPLALQDVPPLKEGDGRLGLQLPGGSTACW